MEDLAEDLISFFFPDLAEEIDWEKEIVSLDKELLKLFPSQQGQNRRADKLFRVWLKNGEQQWLFIHIEAQGYADRGFDRRMYEYYSRIEAKYGLPIVALAIYTDADRSCHFSHYRHSFWGTELFYKFNTFVLLDYPPEELIKSNNIFATVLEAAWQALKKGKWDQEALLASKLELVRRLYAKGFSKKKIHSALGFILYYVNFEKPEYSTIFGDAINAITKTKATMGVIELIQEELKKQAWKEGREEGREEGFDLAIASLLRNGFSPEQISTMLSLPLEKILTVKAKLEQQETTDEPPGQA